MGSTADRRPSCGARTRGTSAASGSCGDGGSALVRVAAALAGHRSSIVPPCVAAPPTAQVATPTGLLSGESPALEGQGPADAGAEFQ